MVASQSTGDVTCRRMHNRLEQLHTHCKAQMRIPQNHNCNYHLEHALHMGYEIRRGGAVSDMLLAQCEFARCSNENMGEVLHSFRGLPDVPECP